MIMIKRRIREKIKDRGKGARRNLIYPDTLISPHLVKG